MSKLVLPASLASGSIHLCLLADASHSYRKKVEALPSFLLLR